MLQYIIMIFSLMSPSVNPQEPKAINQQLDGFSSLCFLETVAFQTAAEHSCWDCVTKHRNSFCIRSQLIVNNRDWAVCLAASGTDHRQITEGPWWFKGLIPSTTRCNRLQHGDVIAKNNTWYLDTFLQNTQITAHVNTSVTDLPVERVTIISQIIWNK